MKKVFCLLVVLLLLGTVNSLVISERVLNTTTERLELVAFFKDITPNALEAEIYYEEELEAIAGSNIEEADSAIIDCIKHLCTEIPQTNKPYQEKIEEYLNPITEIMNDMRKRIEWQKENEIFLGESQRVVPLEQIESFEQEIGDGKLIYENNNFYLEIEGEKIGFATRFVYADKKLYMPFGTNANIIEFKVPEELDFKNGQAKRIEVTNDGPFLIWEKQRKFLVFFFWPIEANTIFKMDLRNQTYTEQYNSIWAYLGVPI